MISLKQLVCFYVINSSLIFACLCTKTLHCSNINAERVMCPSFDATVNYTSRINFKKLNVVNSENIPLSIIKSGTFKNYNNIDDLQIKNLANGIEKQAFDGLNNLYELHLDDNNIEEIVPGVFDNLPIVVLYIYNCGVQKIYPKALNNLPKLKKVYIYGNNINTIEENLFTETWLSTILLRKNHIKFVKENAFARMPFLEFLSLEENELKIFEPHTIIGFAPKLEYFYLNRNEIEQVNKNMFDLMPLLKVLLLNINKIKQIDNNTFEKLSKLRLVDISNNYLKELHPSVFKILGHDEMLYLFIHNNRLTFLDTEVLNRLPILNSISIDGNPWQCPCYNNVENYLKNKTIKIICQDEYQHGNRPYCAISKNHPKQCIYDVNKVEDVIELYDDEIIKYKKLPPVCNIDGFKIPTLGP